MTGPQGSLVLFVGVLADQLGVPLPGLPMLLAAGALAGAGAMHPAGALGPAVGAAVLANLLWYEVGRRHGNRALGLLCRVSLEPDACVRRTQESFVRHGVRLLVFARFVPALGLVAAPLAGMSGLGRGRFLLYDGLGAALWAAGYMGLGYAFSDQLEAVVASAGRTGTTLAVLLLATLTAYFLYKYVRRQLSLRRLRIQRVTPDELRRRQDARDPPVVVDLRHPLDAEAAPYVIPGALRMAVETQRSDECPGGAPAPGVRPHESLAARGRARRLA